MASLKLLILAVLALSWTEYVASQSLQELGEKISEAVEAKHLEAKDVPEFALNFLLTPLQEPTRKETSWKSKVKKALVSCVDCGAKDDSEYTQRLQEKRLKLVDALKRVLKGEECSDSSLDYTALIGKFLPVQPNLSPLYEAAQEYASKCLTSDYLGRKLIDTENDEVGLGIVKLVDEDFNKDYRKLHYEDHGEFDRLYRDDFVYYEMYQSGAVAKILERVAQKEGKDPLEVFPTREAVRSYIKNDIVKPCKLYPATVGKILGNIIDSQRLLRDHGYKLEVLTDVKAQFVSLRNTFCSKVTMKVGDNEDEFLDEVWSKFHFEQTLPSKQEARLAAASSGSV